MKTLLTLAALAFTTSLLAQDLAPLAAKYKADSDSVATERATAVARVARTYELALDAAEKSGTTVGDLKLLAAITAERDALKAGKLKASAPSTLPKNLLAARKAYTADVVKVDADMESRKQRAVADYLRALAALQARTPENVPLIAQIKAEKEGLIRGVPAGLAAQTKRLGGTRWKKSNSGAAFTLKADGTMVSNWNKKGKWVLVTQTGLILWSEDPKSKPWTLDAEANTMTYEKDVYIRQD